jgi:hypothetical protein
MKLKYTDRIHVAMTQDALAKLDRNEMNLAKYGLQFTDQPEPTNLIEPVRKVEPMTFSLANLFPVGV